MKIRLARKIMRHQPDALYGENPSKYNEHWVLRWEQYNHAVNPSSEDGCLDHRITKAVSLMSKYK